MLEFLVFTVVLYCFRALSVLFKRRWPSLFSLAGKYHLSYSISVRYCPVHSGLVVVFFAATVGAGVCVYSPPIDLFAWRRVGFQVLVVIL